MFCLWDQQVSCLRLHPGAGKYPPRAINIVSTSQPFAALSACIYQPVLNAVALSAVTTRFPQIRIYYRRCRRAGEFNGADIHRTAC